MIKWNSSSFTHFICFSLYLLSIPFDVGIGGSRSIHPSCCVSVWCLIPKGNGKGPICSKKIERSSVEGSLLYCNSLGKVDSPLFILLTILKYFFRYISILCSMVGAYTFKPLQTRLSACYTRDDK
ncbi:unnamed protein product [Lactuca virosa]|uniref:Secreted protein n=1 Tax=Lactuca virosa TaxID=75947 RepID=A0AAU9NNX8_9ASTR|nr:unnamed protein product [Lactuca virosa]